MRTRRRVSRTLLVAGVLLANVIAGVAPVAAAAEGPQLPRDREIPVKPVTSHYEKPPQMPAWHPGEVRWPTGTAEVAVPAGSATARAVEPAQAGDLPVWFSATGANKMAAARPAKARVTVADKAVAEAAGVRGLVFSVENRDSAAADVNMALGYGGFQNAFGADWASRLKLVELPACALTTPAKPECRTQKPVRTANDVKAAKVSAEVALAASQVFAVTSDEGGGGGGDFGATSLQPSGSWQAGGPSNAFTWSYPIPVPKVPGGLQPDVTLGYNSQSVDGLTSSTNNQPSWIGDGWDYSPGYIERSFQSCNENPAGPTKTLDSCWSDLNTLTLSLNGRSSVLVKDDNTGDYHPKNDAAELVQIKPGAVNGAQGGEHFVVTTTDGTRYFFGLNRLPGWRSDQDPTTNSVWTAPVYATKRDQPCYRDNFADSWCQQAYRWSLDHVIDTHGNVVSYFYRTETNSYAQKLGSTSGETYIRGGHLTKIQYGQRDGQVYTTLPAAQVLFESTGRCTESTCDPATLSKETASKWPDVPYDLNCAARTACQVQGPSFWSTHTLRSIRTQALSGAAEADVDSWTLEHSFPATGDVTLPVLWLSSITHTGLDTTAAPGSKAITLPAVTFTGRPLGNRVQSNGYPPITRHRLSKVITETGQIVNANYSAPGCASGVPSDPAKNTSLCFPDYWTPRGVEDPVLDWFNKFVVSGVTVQDPTGGSANDTIATTYTPVGTPAWHHNDSLLTPARRRTWSQWRGYSGMIVQVGTAPDPVSKTQYTYFRGMDGDPGATKPVEITGSHRGPAILDSEQYTGRTYETVTFNGSEVVSDTVTEPWSVQTALDEMKDQPTQRAFLTGDLTSKAYTPLADGTVRETRTSFRHDKYGRVDQMDDRGDVGTDADDRCTTTTYADGSARWILDKTAQTKTVSVNCGTTPVFPQHAIADSLTYFDRSTNLGELTGPGDSTMAKQVASYTNGVADHVVTATTVVDQYGRATSSTDAINRTTTTAYSPATGANPTLITVTDPARLVTKTTFNPLRDLVLKQTDAAGYSTEQQYDALGRLIAVYKPGNTVALNTPDKKFTYDVSNTGPSVVSTYTLNNTVAATYRKTIVLYDSLLRPRETQKQTPDNKRTITDTVYNTLGKISVATREYLNGDPVSPVYVQAQAGQIPSATATAYDGAGRKTAETAYALGTATWETKYRYGGNWVTTEPPPGATATTAFSDARGQLTTMHQYHAGAPVDPLRARPADVSATRFTYHPNGKPATVTDAAGNTWSAEFNLLGQQTVAKDPDVGTTLTTYDNAGQVITVTDARNKQLTFTYDGNSRRTGAYDTTEVKTLTRANQVGGWTYDSVKKGYPTASTSYSGGDTFTRAVTAYTDQGHVGQVRTTLTGEPAGLIPAEGLLTSYGYSRTGKMTTLNAPAGGGLQAEQITYGYDTFDQPTSVRSPLATYVQAVGYSHYGQPLQYTLDASPTLWVTMSYDDQTRMLNRIQTTAGTATNVLDEISYTFGNAKISKGSGLLTSTVNRQNGGATVDVQCFDYDYGTRLTDAWTAKDGCAAKPEPGKSSMVGGPSPYWQSWTFDAGGNRATQTDHATTAGAADAVITYNYPQQGTATGQPHTLSSTTATGPAAQANTGSYRYDAAGNTLAVTGSPIGDQTFTWTNQGKLASSVSSAGTTSYVYDTDGNVAVRRDPGKITLFMGAEERVLDTATGTVTGTRYYDIGGQLIASRTSNVANGNPQYVVPDRQNTNHLAIDSATQSVTRRQFMPFGGPRGAVPAVWPGGSKGYVGGTPEPATKLENLGARQYDASTGRFLSPDPKFQWDDPTQMGGYAYAGNDPVTRSDPSGLDAGSWCVTKQCADAGNSSPGLSGYGYTAPPPVSGPVYVYVSPHVAVQAESAGELRELYVAQLPKVAPALTADAQVPLDVEGQIWLEICKASGCEAQLADTIHWMRLGGDDQQLYINSCALTGSCGGASGIYTSATEAFSTGTKDGKAPEKINVAVTFNEEDLAAEARLKRDRMGEARRSPSNGRPGAFIGAYDPETGRVVAACAGGGRCAEGNAVIKLGIDAGKVKFERAFGWRGGEWVEIGTCVKCQDWAKMRQFPPGVLFDPGGDWSDKTKGHSPPGGAITKGNRFPR